MHTQFDKCAYVRNHGHNNMGCGYAPHGGAGLNDGLSQKWWTICGQS